MPIKIKYLSGNQSNLFLSAGNNWADFISAFQQGLKHTDNQASASEINLPDASGYYLQPKHYIVIKSLNTTKNSDTNQKTNLELLSSFLTQAIEVANPVNLAEIILIGNHWKELDVDNIPKSDAITNYIYFNQQVYKLFATPNKFIKAMSQRLIPHSWIWVFNCPISSLILKKGDLD